MCRKTYRGFTLVELLVVIAIIALLVSILLPSLKRAKSLAAVTICAAQMRSLHVPITLYMHEYSMSEPWRFRNGTGDYPTNEGDAGPAMLPGNIAQAIIERAKVLDDPHILFCPSSFAHSEWESVYSATPTGDQLSSTYVWHYKWVPRSEESEAHLGPGSGRGRIDLREGVHQPRPNLLMMDIGLSPALQKHPHCNALFIQGNVNRIGDTAQDRLEFLMEPGFY